MSDPNPKTAGPSPAETTDADKARALLAMLESPDRTARPPAHLRDFARALVASVEGARANRHPVVAPGPGARLRISAKPGADRTGASPARTRLFQNIPPLTLSPEPRVDHRPAARPRLTLSAPMPIANRAAADPSMPSPILGRRDVRRLIETTTDPSGFAREHPAVVASAMAGRPPLEQAAKLRQLSGGRVRAVHRALRQIEAQGADTVSA
ncbi:hypothetical protein [uncultured Jannaschia sp.]|uniref:hypothetical protein n=1 Tax=uncultured Jannaschia sp. TaxID=293347 RepID=UPI002608FE05|nr:hypothetical protein [uncultured Jannaschia sp.]